MIIKRLKWLFVPLRWKVPLVVPEINIKPYVLYVYKVIHTIMMSDKEKN